MWWDTYKWCSLNHHQPSTTTTTTPINPGFPEVSKPSARQRLDLIGLHYKLTLFSTPPHLTPIRTFSAGNSWLLQNRTSIVPKTSLYTRVCPLSKHLSKKKLSVWARIGPCLSIFSQGPWRSRRVPWALVEWDNGQISGTTWLEELENIRNRKLRNVLELLKMKLPLKVIAVVNDLTLALWFGSKEVRLLAQEGQTWLHQAHSVWQSFSKLKSLDSSLVLRCLWGSPD